MTRNYVNLTPVDHTAQQNAYVTGPLRAKEIDCHTCPIMLDIMLLNMHGGIVTHQRKRDLHLPHRSAKRDMSTGNSYLE